eukprot:m.307861 g.307861  ORF g.307861 m.307861 type:complete len:54 (+) comp15937_c2_seq1:1086-1247(+)
MSVPLTILVTQLSRAQFKQATLHIILGELLQVRARNSPKYGRSPTTVRVRLCS